MSTAHDGHDHATGTGMGSEMGPQNTGMDRRRVLAALGVTAGVSALLGAPLAQAAPPGTPTLPGPGRKPIDVTLGLKIFDSDKNEFVLPPLPYDKAALEPHIDAQTMEIHHGKHHQSYVTGLNKALAELAKIRTASGDAALVKHWAREVSFHGSGHINHTLFWLMMAPAGKGGGGQPTGELAAAITRDFGSFEAFVAQFKATATQVEGGGWAWLVLEPLSGRLMLVQGEKQQDMYVTGSRPILGIDVWEHAYYLKHQNKRADYVTAFMNVINWEFCAKLFERAKQP